MTTPQQPTGTSRTHRDTGPAVPSVTGWPVEHTAVAHAAAYLCAGGFVVGLLTGATTVAWLLLAAALTADTAAYGLRARRTRTHREGGQRNDVHASGFHARRDDDAALFARYRTAASITENDGNRTHPLEERNESPWPYRPLPHHR